MDWETFYDRWEDWAESTLIARISSLKSVGPSDEVTEVACFSLSFDASYKLITKAIKLGTVFSFDDIIELDECDGELAEAVLDSGACRLNASQAEKLKELGYTVPKGCIIQTKPSRRASQKREKTVRQKDGFSPLMAYLAVSKPLNGMIDALFGKKNKGVKTCRCTGDCANCPPHYGYRYGRWYYGHGHTHGCEFGGNKGDGGIES